MIDSNKIKGLVKILGVEFFEKVKKNERKIQ